MAALVQYVVAPWLTLNVKLPSLIDVLGSVDGTMTDTLAVSVMSVCPARAMTSNVWVLVLAGPTDSGTDELDWSWIASPGYAAAMVNVNPVELGIFVGVKETSHVAEFAPLWARTHDPELKLPTPPGALGMAVQLTLPVGATAPLPLLSVTVAVQVVVAPTTCGFGCV
jgi:hypothetical protein